MENSEEERRKMFEEELKKKKEIINKVLTGNKLSKDMEKSGRINKYLSTLCYADCRGSLEKMVSTTLISYEESKRVSPYDPDDELEEDELYLN